MLMLVMTMSRPEPSREHRGVAAPLPGHGHPSASDQEWPELAARLRRVGLALTGRPQEADDLVQTALAKVLAEAPGYAMHLGYLRTTLMRVWLDRRRGAKREAARLARVAAARVGLWSRGHAGEAEAVGGLEQREQLARVRAAMDLLPPRQHAALALRLVEELDYPAIAEALGITVGAARANVHLARERVRCAVEVEP